MQFNKKNVAGKMMKIFLGMLMVMCLSQPLKARASEAALYHQHVEGCFTTGPILCTDEVKVTTHAEEFNCTTCGRIAAAHVVVETYSCKHIYSERELRRIAYCYTCHSVVQNVEKGGQPNHYRNGQINVCGFGTDTVVAKVSFTNTNAEWTKEASTLKVCVTEPVAGLSLAPYTYTFSGGTTYGDSCIVSENGVYSVTVTGSNGQNVTTSLEVSNIDKTSPQIQNFYVDKEYPEYESAMLVVEATDTESGLAEKAYSFNGGASYDSVNTCKITSNGTYTVYVQDKVGNVDTRTLTVNCFAKKPETTTGTQAGTGGNANIADTSKIPAQKPFDKSATGLSRTESGSKNTVQNATVKENISDEQKELLKRRLELSDKRVKMENIPGIYSSVLKSNAEKKAVPTTLNVATVDNEAAYAGNAQNEENLVKNISFNEENENGDSSFAQVSKAVVGAGVLICIGMVGFLLVFLVKKQ